MKPIDWLKQNAPVIYEQIKARRDLKRKDIEYQIEALRKKYKVSGSDKEREEITKQADRLKQELELL